MIADGLLEIRFAVLKEEFVGRLTTNSGLLKIWWATRLPSARQNDSESALSNYEAYTID